MATPNKTAAKATLKEEITVESLRKWQKHFKTAQRGWGKFSKNWFHSILYLKYEEFSSNHRSYHDSEWERLKKDTGNFFNGIFIKSRISSSVLFK